MDTTVNTANTLPLDAFDKLQLNAGVLLSDFTPSATPSIDREKIIGATTGGINVSCVPQFEDFAEDVDNAPNNLKEFKRITGYECTISTTLLNLSPASAKLILGAADIDGTNTSMVTPRMELDADTDFADLWWVGDMADGGYVAVKVINALSTGGLSIKSTKNAKGQMAVTFTGHLELADPSVVPMVVYVYPGT